MIAAVVTQLLRAAEITVERAEQVWKAVRQFAAGRADLADCLIHVIATDAGCERTLTFDRAAAKSGGMTLLT